MVGGNGDGRRSRDGPQRERRRVEQTERQLLLKLTEQADVGRRRFRRRLTFRGVADDGRGCCGCSECATVMVDKFCRDVEGHEQQQDETHTAPETVRARAECGPSKSGRSLVHYVRVCPRSLTEKYKLLRAGCQNICALPTINLPVG